MEGLRPYQQEALDNIRASVRGGVRRLIVQAATGAGKTKLAAGIVEGALSKGHEVAFVCPAIGLIDQTVEAFWKEGIREVGVQQANHDMTDYSRPVQVCSIQTIRARKVYPRAAVVIFDEIHQFHEEHKKWLSHEDWAKVPMIGLSATPWTKGLGKYFDSLLVAATTQDLIDQGYLSKFKVFATGHPDLSAVKIVAGDYHEGELSKAMQGGELTADIVKTWQERWGKGKTLCFGVDKLHAKSIQERFEFAGIPCGYQDAETTPDERREIKRKFHSGEYRVVSNIQTLTTGVDWDVRCLIMARPTRSEMLYVQIIGRALRTAPGKDCIARDTLILTDRGEVKIQEVTVDHKIWDGVNFVAHAGAVCKGIRPVITHDGITGTLDHRVMTNEGWKTLSEAHRRCLRIARSGFGGCPIRLAENNFSKDKGKYVQSFGRGRVLAVPQVSYVSVSQHQEAARYSGMSSLQWSISDHRSVLDLSALPSAARSVYEVGKLSIQKLWRSWDRVQIRWSERSRCLGSGEFGNTERPFFADRSEKQRRALRTGKPALGSSNREHEQHETFRSEGQIHRVSEAISRNKICGPNVEQIDSSDDFRRDCSEVASAVFQTEREVWDIYGAGPLQRFTANGRLIHNCAIILDHSDTTQRLGFVTEIHHESLSSAKSAERDIVERKTPLPKECEKCAVLKPRAMRICPNCGHEEKFVSSIMERDGALVEMTGASGKAKLKGKKVELTMPEKAALLSELKALCVQRGYKSGWAARKYKDRTGVWPDHSIADIPPAKVISPTTALWVRAEAVKWAKRRKLEGALDHQ